MTQTVPERLSLNWTRMISALAASTLLAVAACNASPTQADALRVTSVDGFVVGVKVRPPQVVVFLLELFDVSASATMEAVDVDAPSKGVAFKEARASFLKSSRYPTRNGHMFQACLESWPARDYTILQPIRGLRLDPGDKFALYGFFELNENTESSVSLSSFAVRFKDGSRFLHSAGRGITDKIEVKRSKTDDDVCNGGISPYVS